MRKNEGNENRIYQNSIQNGKFECRLVKILLFITPFQNSKHFTNFTILGHK